VPGNIPEAYCLRRWLRKRVYCGYRAYRSSIEWQALEAEPTHTGSLNLAGNALLGLDLVCAGCERRRSARRSSADDLRARPKGPSRRPAYQPAGFGRERGECRGSGPAGRQFDPLRPLPHGRH
jgi:hypothetical protein